MKSLAYEPYERLMSRYLSDDGRVDYARWQSSTVDVEAIESFVGRLSETSPESHSEYFRDPYSKLAYWMNLYNALVIREVIRRWPLESVRDVKSGLFNFGSKGFFAGLEFPVGNRLMSLDDIEHKVIRRQFDDARIHFALNCGANSCPPLRPIAFSGEDLQRRLARATSDFIHNESNVAVDHHAKVLRLSKVFDWYEDDFVKHASQAGESSSVRAFLELCANDSLRSELERAKTYRIEHYDYNWQVNDSGR